MRRNRTLDARAQEREPGQRRLRPRQRPREQRAQRLWQPALGPRAQRVGVAVLRDEIPEVVGRRANIRDQAADRRHRAS